MADINGVTLHTNDYNNTNTPTHHYWISYTVSSRQITFTLKTSIGHQPGNGDATYAYVYNYEGEAVFQVGSSSNYNEGTVIFKDNDDWWYAGRAWDYIRSTVTCTVNIPSGAGSNPAIRFFTRTTSGSVSGTYSSCILNTGWTSYTVAGGGYDVYRYNGTSWVLVDSIYRYNGSQWTEISDLQRYTNSWSSLG